MSRTRRNYWKWIEWIGDFHKRLERGLVSIPKREVLKGRTTRSGAADEIWGDRGKRLRKRILTRKRRKREQADLEERRDEPRTD